LPKESLQKMQITAQEGWGLILMVGGIVGGILSALYWMYLGWRAMIAHERLAQAAEVMARKDNQL
jgi:hypothetical protein